jgi:hypothetical protein
MTVVLTLADCEFCTGRTHGPVGIDCDCGRHFHIGSGLLVRTDDCVRCPSCERAASPLALQPRLSGARRKGTP